MTAEPYHRRVTLAGFRRLLLFIHNLGTFAACGGGALFTQLAIAQVVRPFRSVLLLLSISRLHDPVITAIAPRARPALPLSALQRFRSG
jgi:hypothetical protein